MLRHIALLSAAVAVASFGCAHGHTPARGGRLLVLAQGDVDGLDPAVTYSQFGYMVAQATQHARYASDPARPREPYRISRPPPRACRAAAGLSR
jgi:hypothetical protein